VEDHVGAYNPITIYNNLERARSQVRARQPEARQ